jgi:hypothetical protein
MPIDIWDEIAGATLMDWPTQLIVNEEMLAQVNEQGATGTGEETILNWIEEMLKGNEQLLSEASTSNDPNRLYEIISNSDDLLVLRIAASNPQLDILGCEILAPKYLQELISSGALAAATVNFGPRVAAILGKQAAKIADLQIPADSNWWEFLLSLESDKAKEATAKNPYFPARLRSEVKNLDASVRLGFVLNKTVVAPDIQPFLSDPVPQIKTIAEARMAELQPATTMDFEEFAVKRQKTTLHIKKPISQNLIVVPVLGLTVLLFLISITANNNDKFGVSARGGANQKNVKTTSTNQESTTPTAPPLSPSLDPATAPKFVNPQPTTSATNPPSSSPAPTDAPTPADPAISPVSSANVDFYEEAIALANKATLLSKGSEAPTHRQEIVTLWEEAIKNLKQVLPQSPNYTAAQSKISKYEVIRDTKKRG